MKTLKRFFVAAALCRRWAAAMVVVGALGVPAGALAQLTIEASGVPGGGVTTWTFGGTII